ncbi:MAG: HpnM family protein [Nitrosospira sp.]|nr:HpnM family protein [Nitrosospira sp.]
MKALRAIKFLLQFQMVGVMLLAVPGSSAEDQVRAGPEQIVSEVHDALTRAMREGPTLGYKGRFELLAPVVDKTHELDFIARTALGANWAQLDAGQQRTFTDVFRKLSIGSYAGWFKSHEGEHFEILEQQSLPRNQVMVRSRLVRPRGEPVRFDYVLRQAPDGWRIVNVLADGVSDLALKRVEYRAILQRDGFPALIDMLREKIALTENG